ncbi:MAG: PAS domain-containing protein [Gemmatimonadaceae bacterium]|nr:PAS domain-containing protein [Acetobacteraceae bacterium]
MVAGSGGALAGIVSNLATAQQVTLLQYWTMRDADTRHWLHSQTDFTVTIGADFIIDVAQSAAKETLGLSRGQDFLAALAAECRGGFQAMMMRVQDGEHAPGIVVQFGTDRAAWDVRAAAAPSNTGLHYRLDLSPADAGGDMRPGSPAVSFDGLIDQLPDAFVAVDRMGLVIRVNRAFLDLIQVAAAGTVIGESLGRWLAQPGCDFPALLATLHRHPVRLLETTITGDLGTGTKVELSAAGNTEAQPDYFGIMIHDVSRRAAAPADGQLSAVLDAVTGQIGRTPLLQVVRETADAVERHYIRAALARVDGNRTAAAELLGLSRQSLHTKLNRYAGDGPNDAQSWAAAD